MFEEELHPLCFFTPAFREHAALGFGCASLGIATPDHWASADEPYSTAFFRKVGGVSLHGALTDVSMRMEAFAESPRADAVKGGIVLFGNCGGENTFLKKLTGLFPNVPFAGGSAAIGSDGTTGRILPLRGQVSVLLITDDVCVTTAFLNVYETVITEATAVTDDARLIDVVRINDGARHLSEYIAEQGARFGETEGLTEHFAISDSDGRNIHLIPDGERFRCGADLPTDRKITIRYASTANALQRMQEFYAAKDSLIFGCAGVKSLFDGTALTTGENSLGLFLFGEVVTIGDKSDFANLTLMRMQFA